MSEPTTIENGNAGQSLPPAPWLGVGDLVSVERWDKTERQPNRVGTPATVTLLETGEYSETGIMVTVVGTSGKTLRVDMNWLHPYTPNDRTLRPAEQP